MALSKDELLTNMSRYRFNPVALHRTAIRAINEINNGEQLLFDATNPFVQSLQAGAFETVAFMQQHEAECRKSYPTLAQEQSDLYRHMSDIQFANLFCQPATTVFSLRFFKDELINSMSYEPETGYSKLTIPRNTFFTVGGMAFSMQYPVDIRQLAHGGLQVVYNNELVSPLQELESNSIDYEVQTNQLGDYIKFDLHVMQFSIKQLIEPISLAKDTQLVLPIDDQFFYARVYHKNPTSGKWDEIKTTHADIVYDYTDPTALLYVADGALTVSIPQVYVTMGVLSTSIRVDMYQSKGEINIPLGDFTSSVSITWKTFDTTELKNEYSAPLPNMEVVAYSEITVVGGSNEMPFEERRRNVINNATGPIQKAITTVQLEAKLANKGYEMVENIDDVTNRVILATRAMPSPDLVTATTEASTGRRLITAAAASIETLTVSLESLAGLPSVIDNGKSLTITPDTLYHVVDGVAKPVPQAEIDRLLALPVDQRAAEVNRGALLYTPFHYVLDAQNDAFEIRPYYLDAPSAKSKVFVKQNDTTLMLVGTSSYGVIRTEGGYLLQVVTRSDDVFKEIPDGQVFAQLAFIPPGERDRAYMNGVLVGKTDANERVYNFDLSTTYNISSAGNIEFSKFTMYNTEPRLADSPLENSFDLFYATSAVLTSRWMPNEIDRLLGRHLLPNQIAGINHEKIKIELGKSLDMLWSRARTVASSVTYQTWEEDELAVYPADVLQRDANGVAIRVVDGEIVKTVLHKKGDPILDAAGDPTYTHRAGDFKRDSSGNLIMSNARGLLRQLDMMLLEGAYWFATDITTTNYRTSLANTVVGWLVNDLNEFKPGLLDKTRIYYYPKTTSGVVNVYVDGDIRKSLNAGQGFTLTLAVSKLVYSNIALRERLTASAVEIISQNLQNKTVVVSNIESALRDAFGSDVISIELTGFGGDVDYRVLTIADDTDRLSIRKRATAQADGTIAVEEDVVTNFVLHNS